MDKQWPSKGHWYSWIGPEAPTPVPYNNPTMSQQLLPLQIFTPYNHTLRSLTSFPTSCASSIMTHNSLPGGCASWRAGKLCLRRWSRSSISCKVQFSSPSVQLVKCPWAQHWISKVFPMAKPAPRMAHLPPCARGGEREVNCKEICRLSILSKKPQIEFDPTQ